MQHPKAWKGLSLALALLVAGLAGCHDENAAVAGAPGLQPPWNDPELPARLEQAFDGWRQTFGFNGAAAAVYAPGRLDWQTAGGFDDVELQTPYETATRGRIASATKPFTASLILQLVDEGLLGLDTPLADFLPDYPNAGQITIEHLLRHRSGIPEIQLVDLIFILWVLTHAEDWMTPEELLAWTYAPFPLLSIDDFQFHPREPVGPPGGEYYYSQPGFIALGFVVEQLTGQSLGDAYDERIIQPLGLGNTRLPREDDPPQPTGYTDLFGLLPEKIPGSLLLPSANGLVSASWSAGGILATARDLTRFLAGLLRGELFSTARLANMTDWREQENDGRDPKDRYGMGLAKRFYEEYTTLGHDGALPGSVSVMKYIEELDVYVGAVANTDEDSVPGAPDLVERVRAAILDEAEPG